MFGALEQLRSVSLERLVSDGGPFGIFQMMAWYVVFRLLCSSNLKTVAQWQDFVTAAALSLLLLLPTDRMIWVAAAGVSTYLWIFNRNDAQLRAAAAVLAALSVQEFWGHVFFNLVALPLLRAETAAVGLILEAFRPGTVWQDNLITGPSGYGIVVYTGCSSFQNLSVAMLCWVTVSRLRHQSWRSRDLVTGGAVAATMILLNLTRLCLMAWNIDLFRYWHDGTGAEIFAIGASLTILLISLYGAGLAKRLG
jgi:exosortase/archaeosortase family protein